MVPSVRDSRFDRLRTPMRRVFDGCRQKVKPLGSPAQSLLMLRKMRPSLGSPPDVKSSATPKNGNYFVETKVSRGGNRLIFEFVGADPSSAVNTKPKTSSSKSLGCTCNTSATLRFV